MQVQEPEYLFVDGGYLRGIMGSFSGLYFDDIDIRPLLRGVCSRFRKTFYYDCLPARQDGETAEDFARRTAPQQEYFDELRSYPGVHVIEGVLRGEKRLRQKRVDVAIAVHMLTHSYRRNMTRATLLAGDQDFFFLVEALVQDGLYLTLWFDPTSVSPELATAADAQRTISLENIWEFLPGEIQREYPRPTETERERTAVGEPLKNGEDSRGNPVAVYEESDRYVVVRRPSSSPKREYLLHHPKVEFLLKYADFRWNGITWTT